MVGAALGEGEVNSKRVHRQAPRIDTSFGRKTGQREKKGNKAIMTTNAFNSV